MIKHYIFEESIRLRLVGDGDNYINPNKTGFGDGFCLDGGYENGYFFYGNMRGDGLGCLILAASGDGYGDGALEMK